MTGPGRAADADAVVDDHDLDLVGARADLDLHLAGARVADDVGQRLLDDAVAGGLDRGHRLAVAQIDLVLDEHAGAVLDVLDHRGAERPHRAADLLDGLVDQRGRPRGELLDPLELLGLGLLEQVADQLQVDADGRQRLSGRVVQVAGDRPLLLLLQLDRARRDLAQAVLLLLHLGQRARERRRAGLDQALEARVERGELLAIFEGTRTEWSDGSPIVVLQRERGDSSHAAMARVMPEFAEVDERAYVARRWRVIYDDVGMQDAIASTEGSIGLVGSGSLPEDLPIRVLSFRGVVPTPDAVADGSYPIYKDLSFVTLGPPDARSADFFRFVFAPQGRDVIRDHGCMPLGNPSTIAGSP